MKAVQTRCPQKSPCSVQRFRARFKGQRRWVVHRLLQARLFPVRCGWPWRKKAVGDRVAPGLPSARVEAIFV